MLPSLSCRIALSLVAVSALTPSSIYPARPQAIASRRVVQHPVAVATSEVDKAVLTAAKKVTLAAKQFGSLQGKVAQLWVEEALRGGNANPEGLLEIEAALFDECRIDGEGDCEQLETGMEELLAAIQEKQNKPPRTGCAPPPAPVLLAPARVPTRRLTRPLAPSALRAVFALELGATPISKATAKVRAAAEKFGPEQQAAADAWIGKLMAGELSNGVEASAALLEEEILLFGECVLSEEGTASNCEMLEGALEELQAALDSCGIASTNTGRVMPTNPGAEVDLKGAPAVGRIGHVRHVRSLFERRLQAVTTHGAHP